MRYSRMGIYNFQNHITLQKVKNMKHFVSPTSNSAPKMVVRPASSGEIIVVLFRTKYAVPLQIKSGILQSIIRGGQSDYSIDFIFGSFEEKDYYCVVSVGQLIFDCRSHCGLSHRMQGCTLPLSSPLNCNVAAEELKIRANCHVAEIKYPSLCKTKTNILREMLRVHRRTYNFSCFFQDLMLCVQIFT